MLRSRSAHVSSRYRLRRGETRRRDRFVCWRNNRRHRRTHKMEPRYVLPSYIFRHTISPRRYLEFAVKCNELAKLAKTEDRMILKEMAEAWRKLAREADRKDYSKEARRKG